MPGLPSLSSSEKSLVMKVTDAAGQGVVGLAYVLVGARPETFVVTFMASELPTFHPPRMPDVIAVRTSLSQTFFVGVWFRTSTVVALAGALMAIFPVALRASGGS